MLKNLKISFNDNILIILLGLNLSIYPLCFILGSLIINLNTLCIGILFLIICFKNNLFNIFKNRYFILLGLLWLSFLINLFFSTNFENSLLRVIGFFRFILLAFAVKFFFENCTNNLKNKVHLIWLITLIIISLDLILEYFTGQNILGYSSPMRGRLSGFLADELKIGHLYLGFFIICYVTFFRLTKNYSLLTLFIIFGIFISLIIGERANFLRFFAISFIFFLFFEKKNFKIKILFLLFAFLITFVVINFNNEYKKRFYGQLIKPIIESKSLKVMLDNTVHGANYNRGIEIFKKNQFFGVGINNFRIESGKKIYDNKNLKFNDNGASTHPHQIHIELLSETGIFGYSSFLIFMIISMFFSFKNFIKNRNLYVFAAFLFITFVLLPIVPTGSFFTTFGATIFWINYGLMINESNNLFIKK